MAPRKLSVTEMLAKKGYDVDEEEIGTVVDVDGKNYEVVKNDDGDKVFVEMADKELEAETYDEPKVVEEKNEEEITASTDKVEVGEEVVEKKEEKEKKPRKPRAKKDNDGEEKKPRKPRAKKDTVAVVEESADEETKEVAVESDVSDEKSETVVIVEEVKKEKKPRKPRAKKEKVVGDESNSSSSEDGEKKKRKRRDPSKPKRIREKTCHNVYISEKIFELQKSHPDMTGRERFAFANKLWKELDSEVKGKLLEEFKAAKAQAKVDAEIAVEA
jgi:hypothetical protein